MTAWPDAVRRVTEFLAEAGAEVRVEEFPAGTHTAQEAADAIGCTLPEIVKSLVFEGSERSVVALVPGDRRADAAKIAGALGADRVRVAAPERVRDLTGFEPGAVAPFGLDRVDLVIADRRLMLFEAVWVGSGSPTHLARVAPPELVRLSQATVLDLVADP
jgi:prolyl-tRNA editing enzyme YbaK/EbsC (Cys-tRNA(Pro) deacylase)